MKMDKTFSRSYSHKDQPKESSYYKNLSQDEVAEIFFELMKAAYGFKEWPRMDKTVSSVRKSTLNG